jgi:hypothetical protein
MINFKELREQLTDESIKEILAQFNVEPVDETAEAIIFPTCCHNLEGGSPKLYYYKDSKMFHCYTECASTFDIFTLLQKMYALRNENISLRQAISICNLDSNFDVPNNIDTTYVQDTKYMQTLNGINIKKIDDIDFKVYDKNVLRQFNFDYMGVMPWIQEGISVEAMQRFNIKYNSKQNAIIIPNFDWDGNLIGIRERFFNKEDVAKGKYRPMYWKGVLYNHPTGETFYGIYENHNIISQKHMAIIFEGEKSVLKMLSIYGDSYSLGLATLGQNITNNHIQYLMKMGVKDVILAYDSDYEDYEQLTEVENKYRQKGKILSPYFNTSILMDFDFVLPYKSSPIDGGKEIFEKLLKEREYIA